MVYPRGHPEGRSVWQQRLAIPLFVHRDDQISMSGTLPQEVTVLTWALYKERAETTGWGPYNMRTFLPDTIRLAICCILKALKYFTCCSRLYCWPVICCLHSQCMGRASFEHCLRCKRTMLLTGLGLANQVIVGTPSLPNQPA